MCMTHNPSFKASNHSPRSVYHQRTGSMARPSAGISARAAMLLATLVLVVQAQPYFYEDFQDTDLMDDYQVYNLHFKYDSRDEDYLDWDLGLDEPLTKPSTSSSSSKTTAKPTAGFTSGSKTTSTSSGSTTTSESPFDDDMSDFFFDKEHPYFRYYDDIYGDYFMEDPFESQVDCTLQDDGTPKLAEHSACDLSVEGADKVLTLLPGGIDGVYKFVSCQHGRPMYLRQNSPAGQDRVLWYFNTFKDWDINNGTKPNEDDILVYGGQGDSELRPHYVQANQWHVASDMSKGYTGQEDYLPVELTVKCADGSETEKPAPQNNLGSRPLLTDGEMERQYAVVYKRAAKHAAREDDVNLGLVSLFVFLGLGIIFGLPFLVARTRKQRRRGPASREKGLRLSTLVSNKKAEHSQ